MTRGGICPRSSGTLSCMVLVVIAFAVPIGVLSAVYLVEYENSRFKKDMRMVVLNLAGVPSVVYGLLGLGLFVYMIGIGSAACLAAGLTLGVMCCR